MIIWIGNLDVVILLYYFYDGSLHCLNDFSAKFDWITDTLSLSYYVNLQVTLITRFYNTIHTTYVNDIYKLVLLFW